MITTFSFTGDDFPALFGSDSPSQITRERKEEEEGKIVGKCGRDVIVRQEGSFENGTGRGGANFCSV